MRLQRETATDGGLEHYPEAGSAANIGIMLVRPSCNDFAKVTIRRITTKMDVRSRRRVAWPDAACSVSCEAPCHCMADLRLKTCHYTLQEWVDKILADENYWDQNAFNDLMVRGAIVEPRRKDRLFLCALA